MFHLRLRAAIALALAAVPLSANAAGQPVGLPPGAVSVSPCVPGMGEHWASPAVLPFGPIYGVADGKVVFTEVMIDQKAFATGTSWHELLKPLDGHAIDHVDIDFEPHGHPGYPIPHYDVHAYYVSHAAHERFCSHVDTASH